jgi:hypothetical protein
MSLEPVFEGDGEYPTYSSPFPDNIFGIIIIYGVHTIVNFFYVDIIN